MCRPQQAAKLVRTSSTSLPSNRLIAVGSGVRLPPQSLMSLVHTPESEQEIPNTKYMCDTGQTRNKLLEQWVHLTNHAAGHSRPGTTPPTAISLRQLSNTNTNTNIKYTCDPQNNRRRFFLKKKDKSPAMSQASAALHSLYEAGDPLMPMRLVFSLPTSTSRGRGLHHRSMRARARTSPRWCHGSHAPDSQTR